MINIEMSNDDVKGLEEGSDGMHGIARKYIPGLEEERRDRKSSSCSTATEIRAMIMIMRNRN